jgi:membrane protein YdbS with pleckstrin-like domain
VSDTHAENGSAHEAASSFETLDPRVVFLFRFSAFVACAFLLIPLFTALALLGYHRVIPPWLAGAATVPLIAIAVWAIAIHPGFHYRSWRFRIAHGICELRYGVFVHREVHIPLSRLQHVDIRRGPLERRLGLATLMLYTAGTSYALQSIPGLNPERAAELRDRFLRFEGDDAV